MSIYTIGYEGLSSVRFLDILRTNQIELLVDVRALPLSRKKGFSKNSLRIALEEHSVDYLHAKEFGCPNVIRNHYKANKDWDWYTTHFLEHLATLDGEVEDFIPTVLQQRCALMCFEADHQFCHRHFIAERVAQFQEGLQVIHLTANDWLIPKVKSHQTTLPGLSLV